MRARESQPFRPQTFGRYHPGRWPGLWDFAPLAHSKMAKPQAANKFADPGKEHPRSAQHFPPRAEMNTLTVKTVKTQPLARVAAPAGK